MYVWVDEDPWIDKGRIALPSIYVLPLISLFQPRQIGLLATALIPLMGAASVIRMRMSNGTYDDTEGLDGGAGAGVILGGALNGVSTVIAFNMQHSIAEQYSEVLEHKPTRDRYKCFVLHMSSAFFLVFG